ncbi:DEAD/DEAH box helicase [bacterium]|nr:MAG: DEAD/DEAH box helicase [bacterium]
MSACRQTGRWSWYASLGTATSPCRERASFPWRVAVILSSPSLFDFDLPEVPAPARVQGERREVPPCTFDVRSYQTQAIQAVLAAMDRGVRRGLIVMPTGCGKTKTFAELIRQLSDRPEFEALVIAHRFELLEQGRRAIGEVNPHLIVSTEAGDDRATEGADVVMAGVQSIGRTTSRLSWLKPTLIVTDEAHHAAAPSYGTVYERYGVYDDAATVFHLGVTATPHRLDNKRLSGNGGIFEEVLFTYTLREAIAAKFLTDIKGYRIQGGADLTGVKTTAGDYNLKQLEAAVNTPKEIELAYKAWQEHAEGRKTIVFCTGVDHAKDVAAVFEEHGVSARAVYGDMDRDARAATLRMFTSGQVQVLTSMDVLTEGFDEPSASCVLLIRPTQSWALFTQMVGRGLRLFAGKSDCVVIDVVGVTQQHALGKAPPPGKERPSLSGLVDLPDIDLQGHTLSEALDLFEGMDEGQQEGIRRRPTTFRGLVANTEAVDMLGELSTPIEAGGATELAWFKVGEARYVVACGSSAGEDNREGHLAMDTLGRWWIRLRSSKREEKFIVRVESDDLPLVFVQADLILSDYWPGIKAIASTKAPWRKLDPSTKQIAILKRFKLSDETIAMMNRGMVDQFLRRKSVQRAVIK